MLCVADSWGSEAVNEEPMSLFRQGCLMKLLQLLRVDSVQDDGVTNPLRRL